MYGPFSVMPKSRKNQEFFVNRSIYHIVYAFSIHIYIYIYIIYIYIYIYILYIYYIYIYMLIYIYVGLYIYKQIVPFVYIQNPSLFSWSLIPSSLHSLHPDAAVEAEAWTQNACDFLWLKDAVHIYIYVYISIHIHQKIYYIYILYVLYTTLCCSNIHNHLKRQPCQSESI